MSKTHTKDASPCISCKHCKVGDTFTPMIGNRESEEYHIMTSLECTNKDQDQHIQDSFQSRGAPIPSHTFIYDITDNDVWVDGVGPFPSCYYYESDQFEKDSDIYKKYLGNPQSKEEKLQKKLYRELNGLEMFYSNDCMFFYNPIDNITHISKFQGRYHTPEKFEYVELTPYMFIADNLPEDVVNFIKEFIKNEI